MLSMQEANDVTVTDLMPMVNGLQQQLDKLKQLVASLVSKTTAKESQLQTTKEENQNLKQKNKV